MRIKKKEKIIKYRDIELPDNYHEIQFNNWKKAVRDYKFWERAAQTNEYVADLLYRRNQKKWAQFPKMFEDLSTGRIIIMFYGLAIEGYLKSTLIQHGQIEIFKSEVKGELSGDLTTHDLISLFQQAIDRELTREKSELLSNLKRAITSGKYFFEKVYNPNPYFISLADSVGQAKILIQEIKNLLN